MSARAYRSRRPLGDTPFEDYRAMYTNGGGDGGGGASGGIPGGAGYDISGGQAEVPTIDVALPSYIPDVSVPTISVQDLQQEYKAHPERFSTAPTVPPQYTVGPAYRPQSPHEALLLNADPDVWVIPAGGKGLIAGQEDPKFAFRDVSPGVPAPRSDSGVASASGPVATSTQALPQTPQTGLVGVLGTPVIASFPALTWGWALAIVAALIVISQEKR